MTASGSEGTACADAAARPAAMGGRRLRVLGMGGTIAGRSAEAADTVGYRAGALPVDVLLEGIPRPAGWVIEAQAVARIDSKDLALPHWQALAAAVQDGLDDPSVGGVVITHGTDTLEETAYLLHRLLGGGRPLPVVLTAAMRPATALSADGPRNLADALQLAAHAAAQGWDGVVALVGGRVWSGAELRKRHSRRLDAFDAGDAGPLARIDDDGVTALRPWPAGGALGLQALKAGASTWPWVEILTSHAGAEGRAVDALVAAGVQGLVLACTGNGTVHEAVEAAARRAVAAGVPVWRASRCAAGGIVAPGLVPAQATGGSGGEPEGAAGTSAMTHAAADKDVALPSAGGLTPVQARIELALHLLLDGRALHSPAS